MTTFHNNYDETLALPLTWGHEKGAAGGEPKITLPKTQQDELTKVARAAAEKMVDLAWSDKFTTKYTQQCTLVS